MELYPGNYFRGALQKSDSTSSTANKQGKKKNRLH